MATSEDLTAINTAIANYRDGKRVGRVDFTDGRSVHYAQTSYAELRSMKADILRELSVGAKSYLKIASRKGL